MKAFYENNDFMIRIWEEADFSFPLAHWHNKVELAFILDGSIMIGVNNDKRLLHNGDMVILGSGDIHYYDGRNHKAQVLILIFKPEMINSVSRWPDTKRFQDNYVTTDKYNSNEIIQLKQLAYQLKKEIEKKDDASKLLIRSHLFHICGILLREIPTVKIEPDKTDKFHAQLKIQQDIFTYIEKNYMNDISVISISNHFNMSPKYFSKIFNSISSVNFKTHLNKIRIENAERLISEGKYTLTEIAFMCGFNSVRTFNRAFQSIREVAPSQLKEMMLK